MSIRFDNLTAYVQAAAELVRQGVTFEGHAEADGYVIRFTGGF